MITTLEKLYNLELNNNFSNFLLSYPHKKIGYFAVSKQTVHCVVDDLHEINQTNNWFDDFILEIDN